VIGMSALSASVIGGPLTMTFIALESTGDLWLTTAVLIAVIISSQVTREAFGYSFATWRFHLRGETIRSAADIGWMRDLTVGKMMRHDVRTVPPPRQSPHFAKPFRSAPRPTSSPSTSAAVMPVWSQVADAHAAEVSPEKFRPINRSRSFCATPTACCCRA
jgi:CIC family chloride channel protein